MGLTELAEHMGVTPGTMSVQVERLARRGYVLRARDPRDARRRGLRLSASGMRLREAKSVLEPERVRRMLNCLAPDERETGLRGLELLARAADESMRRRSQARRARRER